MLQKGNIKGPFRFPGWLTAVATAAFLLAQDSRQDQRHMTGTRRQQAIRKSLRAFVPHIPLGEAEDVLARAGSAKMKSLPPSTALWLCLTSHIRHRHTDYDLLLGDGYERDAARFFVAGPTDAVLATWGCARGVADLQDGEDMLPDA